MPSDQLTARNLNLTTLEDRTNPTPLTALTSTNQLLSFDSTAPGTITATVPVTGLAAGENLVAIDYRPSNGQLVGLANAAGTSRLYALNPTSGLATPIGAGFAQTLSGTGGVGFDFNPTVDKIRLVTSDASNLRVNADTGVVIANDTKLAYDPTDFDLQIGGTPPTPLAAAAAYTLNPRDGTTVTSLYGLDSGLDVLFLQGGAEGDPSPNGGKLTVVSKLGFDVTPESAFDIEAGTDQAFFTSGSTLYALNLTTGASQSLGAVGGQSLRGLSVAPPTTGPGTFALPATFAFDAGRGPIQVQVTRTGGASLPATVSFATANGTAVAGTDYLPNSGTLTFAPGETTRLVTLALPGGVTAATPERTFTLTLTNPTGGAALGAATATVTIPATGGPVVQSGRVVAVGAGASGGPRVTVYDGSTGAQLYTFFAFEPTFTGGVTVATADTNGDGFDDIIVGAGNGGGPRIAVFDGSFQGRSSTNRGPVLADFFAYEDSFRGGVIAAAGDVNGDGFDDILAGTGVGGGPRVRVFSGTQLTVGGVQPSFQDFFAYEDSFRGGVNVAASDLNQDGFDEVIAGAGNGGGPRVRTFDGKTSAPLRDFFAYEEGFRGGVFVTAGNVTADGRPDIVTGTGPGGGPLVRIFDGANPQAATAAPAFNAFADSARGGVRVGVNDLGPDGFDEIFTAPGSGLPGAVRAYNAAGTQVAELPFDNAFTGGLFVG